jgi:DNA polymerase-3 subunit alpha
LVGLVADAQHRVARSGNKYGNFVIEDYSGKTEFPLFGEDYLRLHPMLMPGSIVLVNGCFRQRYNKDEFEFKVSGISLAENMKKTMTRQVILETHPQYINKDVVSFIEHNLRTHPGKSSLKFILNEPRNKMKISLLSMNNGFEVNEELIQFLETKPELEVQVVTI